MDVVTGLGVMVAVAAMVVVVAETSRAMGGRRKMPLYSTDTSYLMIRTYQSPQKQGAMHCHSASH